MRALRIILMALAFISLPVHAKGAAKQPNATTPPSTVKAAKSIPAKTTASNTPIGNNFGGIYEPGGVLNSCAQSFIMPEPYNWHAYRNICSDAIHITFRPKTAPLISRTSVMDLAPGQSNTTGYSTSDTSQGLLAGVCRKDFVPVDAQNKMWEAIEGVSFRCMRVSGTSPKANEVARPQKNASGPLPAPQSSVQGRGQQIAAPLKDAERQAHGADAKNGNNTTAVTVEKPVIPQPTPNSFETEKIGKGFVVALDCGKNVKGALQVAAEIGDPPNAVVFKNISSSDIFLVAGARRVDGYGSEALVLQPDKEHKIVRLKVDRNYNYGEWYAVYSDKAATQPSERNGGAPSADQARCLSRMNEIIKSFW